MTFGIYIGNSPYIDASNAQIKIASREMAAIEVESDWERVEQIYDYVREKVSLRGRLTSRMPRKH